MRQEVKDLFLSSSYKIAIHTRVHVENGYKAKLLFWDKGTLDGSSRYIRKNIFKLGSLLAATLAC
jgi:hypothetical protein